MNDPRIVRNLDAILEYLHRVEAYFAGIKAKAPQDFVASLEGTKSLDAIAMMLVSVGESVKRIDKLTDGGFLIRYHETDWQGVMRAQDILTRHYEKVDYEIVFHVCTNHVQPLRRIIERMIRDLTEPGENIP